MALSTPAVTRSAWTLVALLACAPAEVSEETPDTEEDSASPAARCEPVATIQGTDHTEEDTITIDLACSSDADPSLFTPSIYSATHNFGLTADGWTAVLETGTADAGPVEIVFMVSGCMSISPTPAGHTIPTPIPNGFMCNPMVRNILCCRLLRCPPSAHSDTRFRRITILILGGSGPPPNTFFILGCCRALW